MSELKIVSDGIYELDGERWISPFGKFSQKSEEDKRLLELWRGHYTRLGIKTQVHRGLLLVNTVDDQ